MPGFIIRAYIYYMELVFATNNPDKLREINNLLGESFRLKSLNDIGFTGDIPEIYPTLEENASAKAFYIYNMFQADCFADDTGLEVEALNNRPGVYSARFAEVEGKRKFSDRQQLTGANIEMLLKMLEDKDSRRARFRTVISLVLRGEEYRFEGVVNGRISCKKLGTGGFGYDPVFIADGYDRTFAEMSLDEKNRISHRARAFGRLVEFLRSRE